MILSTDGQMDIYSEIDCIIVNEQTDNVKPV